MDEIPEHIDRALAREPIAKRLYGVPCADWLDGLIHGSRQTAWAVLWFALFPIMAAAAIFILVIAASQSSSGEGLLILLGFFYLVYLILRIQWQVKGANGLGKADWRVLDFQTGAYRDITDYISWAGLLKVMPKLAIAAIIGLEALAVLGVIVWIYMFTNATGWDGLGLFIAGILLIPTIKTIFFLIEIACPIFYIYQVMRFGKYRAYVVVISIMLVLNLLLFFIACAVVVAAVVEEEMTLNILMPILMIISIACWAFLFVLFGILLAFGQRMQKLKRLSKSAGAAIRNMRHLETRMADQERDTEMGEFNG